MDDLGIGLVKVRNEYKTVIEILEKIKKGESISEYQKQKETLSAEDSVSNNSGVEEEEDKTEYIIRAITAEDIFSNKSKK